MSKPTEDMKVHVRGDDITDIIYKVIVVGDPSIGKTSLIRKFVQDQFEVDYIPTVGVNISKQPIEIMVGNKKIKINLMIWDLAGQGQFYMLHKVYYNGANGIILAFDLTRTYTFTNVKNWHAELMKFGLSSKPMMLVGNKADLKKEIKVSDAHIEHMKQQLGIAEYVETSALDGKNVQNMFETIARLIYQQ